MMDTPDPQTAVLAVMDMYCPDTMQSYTVSWSGNTVTQVTEWSDYFLDKTTDVMVSLTTTFGSRSVTTVKNNAGSTQ